MIVIEGFAREGADQPAIPEHGDTVGDVKDFVNVVRDEYHSYTARAYLEYGVKQAPCLKFRQCRGGFIEYQHRDLTALSFERPSDCDPSSLGRSQLADRAINVNLEVQGLKCPSRSFPASPPRYASA